MKLIVIVLSTVIGVTLISSFLKPNPISFTMQGEEWTFPSTVAQAVKKHGLEYKPPAFHYKIFPDSCEASLDFDYEIEDFDNEYQPKTVTFPRNVNTYLFIYPIREGLYDSLRAEMESVYKKKFVLNKGTVDYAMLESVRKRRYGHRKELLDQITAMFKNMPIDNPKYAFDLMKVNDDLTVGISKGRETVVVRFMYNLSLAEQVINMRNYVR